MGNALHAGDGLTIAEISAIESYSIGMTSMSRTTTDDNTASVATRQQLTARDERDSGGGRLHHKRSASSKTSSRRGIGTNPSRNSRHHAAQQERPASRTTNRYDNEYAEGAEASRSSTRYDMKYIEGAEASRSPTRYDSKYIERTDDSRTETSSAYHHGYRMRNECRDDKEEEIFPEGGTYQEGETYREGETYQDSGTYREDEGYEYRYEKMNNGHRSHFNSDNINSKSSKHSNRHHHERQFRHQTGTSNIYSAKQDSTVGRESRTGGDGISTLGDIPPAETDMAYAGSEEEDLPAVRDKEIPQFHFEENYNEHKDRYSRNERETTGSNYHFEAKENETRRKNFLLGESGRDLFGATSSTVKDSARPAGKEPRVQPLLEGTESESMAGDSFSTLTKTLTTQFEGSAVLRKENEHNLKKMKEAVGSSDQISTPPVEATDEEEEEENPAQRKLEELLRQQQLQEEKLQKQLEQLRIQKEKLQQLQDEKLRNTRDSDKTFEDNRAAANQDWSLSEFKNEPTGTRPSRDNSKNAQTSVESSRHEKTRRERLEKARQKVMPLSPSRRPHVEEKSKASNAKKSPKESDSFFNFENVIVKAPSDIAAVEDFTSLEEKYAGHDNVPALEDESSSGTATGEMEGSVPEFEDVPSHCKINQSAPDPFQENDLTTISASLLTNELDDSSTVSSMKDGQVGGNQQDELESLDEVLSSMDEEIDLDFVAKYDKAFNAFLDAYPALFDRNSELIQNLKVAKLQRILEVSYQTECDLEAQLETPSEVKTNLEAEFQRKLKEASRQKAERSIQLRADMNQLKKQSRAMEGALTWDMVQLSIKRASKLNKIKTEQLEKSELGSREELLAAMPNGPAMDEIKKAMKASPRDSFGSKQKKDLQQFQVDNAFLGAEVKVLQEKILALKEQAKQLEWVDTTLLRMDEKKLKRLKSRYQKKLGVSF